MSDPTTPEPTPEPGQTPPPPPAAGATPYSVPVAAPAKTPILSIISLIAGIVGLLGFWVVFIPIVGPIMQLVLPGAAVVLGFMGKRREPQSAKGFWLTGIITGFIGLAIGLIALVLWIIALAVFGSMDYTY